MQGYQDQCSSKNRFLCAYVHVYDHPHFKIKLQLHGMERDPIGLGWVGLV